MHPESSPTRPTTLLLCRHGESVWNAAGRIQGQSPDAPGLTDKGRQQARQLAARLQDRPVAAMYSSDLARALETARVVGATLGLEPIPDPRWREVDLGRWQGLTGEEVRARWPAGWQALQDDDLGGGGGESYAEVQARALDAAWDLARRHPGQTICIVCHGGPIRTLLAGVQGIPLAEARQRIGPIRNTSVTILQARGDRFHVLAEADAGHLHQKRIEEHDVD